MWRADGELEEVFEDELSSFAPPAAPKRASRATAWEEGPFASEEFGEEADEAPQDELEEGELEVGGWGEGDAEGGEAWGETEDLEHGEWQEGESGGPETRGEPEDDFESEPERGDWEREGSFAREWEDSESVEAFDPELVADDESLAQELGEDQASRGTVTYPSGESLPIVTGPDASDADEYWDPNRAGVPLVDTGAGQAQTRLSANFTVGELARSGSHRFEKARIDPNLVKCLQAIRDRVGRAVRVNSGYRSWGYNQQLYRGRKQKPTKSRHCSGQAVDIRIGGMSGLDVAKAAIDACGDKIGVGVDKGYAHFDVRGTWARWTYPGLGGAQARDAAIAELEAYRRRRVAAPPAPTPAPTRTPAVPSPPAIPPGIPSLGGNPVPPGYRKERRGRGLGRYGGGRLDVTLLRLRQQRKIAITDDQIDTLQRIANVESSKLLNALNTWDDAVVSLGFMQLTLKWGELQKWIARAPAAFARYGIVLDEGRTYSWGAKNRQAAIRGAADKNELRWDGWAERFFRAGADEDAIVAEIELAREILRKHLARLQNFVKDVPSGFDRWRQHYRASAHLRGLFHEGYNNRPVYALRAAASALRAAPAETTTERFVQIYGDALIAAYGADAPKAQRIIAKTAEGARLGAPAVSPPTARAATPPPPAPAPSPTGGSTEIAPFAVPSRFGYRPNGRRRRGAVYGIVVHTTGSGPASRAARNRTSGRGCQTGIDCALQYYRQGSGGFPHYVIDFDGTVHATCAESHIAWHAGWTAQTGGRNRWRSWSPPSWWARVWGANKTPLDLIPSGANSPNSRHLGIEILGAANSGPYTDAQYTALARLVADIDRRHGLGLDRAPSPRLLGHEDVNPLTGKGGRADAKGGWDPGAHRVRNVEPRFSWSRLWSLITQARTTREAEWQAVADARQTTGEYEEEQFEPVGSDTFDV